MNLGLARVSAPLVATLALALGGCGSAPHDDTAQSSDDALTVYKSGTMTASGLTLLQSLMGTGSASVSATEAAIHFAPSSQMATLGASSFDYAATDYFDTGFNQGVRLKSFAQQGTPTFAFEASGPGSIDMHLVLTGDVYTLLGFCYKQYPCITGGGNTSAFFGVLGGTATVDARFVVDANGVLGVDAVATSYPYVVVKPNNALLNASLDNFPVARRPQIEGWLAGEIKNALAQSLAQHQATFIGGMNRYVNYQRFGAGPTVEPLWQTLPSSLAIAAGGMAWTAKREYPTNAPTGCTASTACEGIVTVACTPSTDRLELEYYSVGGWVPEFQQPISASTSWAFKFTAKGASTMSLRVCNVNSTGKTCGAPMLIHPNNGHCPPLCTRDEAGVLHCVTGGTGGGGL